MLNLSKWSSRGEGWGWKLDYVEGDVLSAMTLPYGIEILAQIAPVLI